MPITIGLGSIILLILYVVVKRGQKRIKEENDRRHAAKVNALSIEEKKLLLAKTQGKSEQFKTNHILHLLLSICTGGIWLFFWYFISRGNSAKRAELEKTIDAI